MKMVDKLTCKFNYAFFRRGVSFNSSILLSNNTSNVVLKSVP